MINLPMDLLRSFVTIADIGNLTRAAERLGRSQPAVSLQLKRLEELTGVSLFDRAGRQLRLTAAGEGLIIHARQILCLNDEAVSSLQDDPVEGTIRVGLPNDFAVSYLPVILGRFAAAHPDVALDVNCAISRELLEGLDQGDYEVVIALLGDRSGRPAAKVWSERLVWAGGSKMARSEADPLALIAYPEGCTYRRHAIDALGRAGRAWRLAYVSPSLSGIFAAVEAGLGVTVLSESTLPPELRRLAADEGLPGLPDVEVGLFYRPETLSQPAIRLVNFALAAMDERHGPQAA